MIEKRLDRIEDMLSQLIGMVGKLSEEQQEMKKELAGVKDEQQEMKKELVGVKDEQKGMKQEQQGMKRELQEMKKEQQEMKKELLKTNIKLDELEQKSEKRHEEVIERCWSFNIFKIGTSLPKIKQR